MTRAVSIAQGGSNNVTMRNRIINGGMMIAQRGAGPTSTGFLNQIDMFSVGNNISATFTYQQSSDAPAGFKNSALVTITGTATAGATDYLEVRNRIEGYNIADLGFGTSGASTITLSFWVKSSLTGTFGGSLNNSAFDYCFPFSYTISAANTWEYKTVTITGATAGTWLSTNSTGFAIQWSLGLGSTYLGTAGAWIASRKQGVTGQVQMCQTNGATFQLTGVQLEAGTTATPFEQRLYGTELALCQRYYAKLTSLGQYAAFASGYASGGTSADVYIKYPVAMRSAATVNYSTARINSATVTPAITSLGSGYSGSDSAFQTFIASGGGLTAGQAVLILSNNSTSGYIDLSAEL